MSPKIKLSEMSEIQMAVSVSIVNQIALKVISMMSFRTVVVVIVALWKDS